MQLLINLPDSDYERIKELVANDKTYTTKTTVGTAYLAIADGVPYNERPQVLGCFNCRYNRKAMTERPCCSCDEQYSEWKSKDGDI